MAKSPNAFRTISEAADEVGFVQSAGIQRFGVAGAGMAQAMHQRIQPAG